MQTTLKEIFDQGETAFVSGDYRRAENLLRRVIERKDISLSYPQLSLVLENLALVFIKQKRFVRAERVLRRARATAACPVASCRVVYKMCELFMMMGRLEGAQKLQAEAEKLAESCPIRDLHGELALLIRIADLWDRLGCTEQAADTYKKAKRLRQMACAANN